MRAKRVLLGVALGLALAAWPRYVARGEGSGSDRRGDYDYRWAQFRISRLAVEIHWWPDC